MCIVSAKIKFCTCVTGDVEQLKNYWKLYRFDKNISDLPIEDIRKCLSTLEKEGVVATDGIKKGKTYFLAKKN